VKSIREKGDLENNIIIKKQKKQK